LSLFILGPVTAESAGSFDVVVTNPAGTVTSSVAVLSVTPPVVFTASPSSLTVYAGTSASFSVSVAGYPGAPALQWRKNGVAIAGATTASLNFSPVQSADVGSYDVVGTTSAGSATSAAAALTVTDAAPSITAQPVGATLAVGGNVTLGVSAVGSAPLTYQWRLDGAPLTPEQTLAGRSGACRDTAMLYVVACRSQGLAARFVSGYSMHHPEEVTEHELHAWAEVYVSGGGWRAYDPSLGLAVADGHVTLAAAPDHVLAAAVSGSYRGSGVGSELAYAVRVQAAESLVTLEAKASEVPN
jgi:transglutaminase-like putative cysteine protease